MSISESIKTADFKLEKHVPVIEVSNGLITVSVGKEISHPNTLEHQILWIDLYFKATDGKFIQHIGRVSFASHGEGGLFTEPYATFKVKCEAKGTLTAVSYCNIHGLWESSVTI